MNDMPVSKKTDLIAGLTMREGSVAFAVDIAKQSKDQVGVSINEQVHCSLEAPHGLVLLTSIRPLEDADSHPQLPADLRVMRLASEHLRLSAKLGDYYVEFDTGDSGEQRLLMLSPSHCKDDRHMTELRGTGSLYQVMGEWTLQMQGTIFRILCPRGRLMRSIHYLQDANSIAA